MAAFDKRWGTDALMDWFAAMGLEMFVDGVAAHGLDGQDMFLLEDAELVEAFDLDEESDADLAVVEYVYALIHPTSPSTADTIAPPPPPPAATAVPPVPTAPAATGLQSAATIAPPAARSATPPAETGDTDADADDSNGDDAGNGGASGSTTGDRVKIIRVEDPTYAKLAYRLAEQADQLRSEKGQLIECFEGLRAEAAAFASSVGGGGLGADLAPAPVAPMQTMTKSRAKVPGGTRRLPSRKVRGGGVPPGAGAGSAAKARVKATSGAKATSTKAAGVGAGSTGGGDEG